MIGQYRLSPHAQKDYTAILRDSHRLSGPIARQNYKALLLAAFDHIAIEPFGPMTLDRSAVLSGVRSFHLRHARKFSRSKPVDDPSHLVFFRVLRDGSIDVLRIFHERMNPVEHL